MNSPSLRPIQIRRVPEERLLAIEWEDGSSSSCGYDLLRGYCPCAGCQGHSATAVVFHPSPQPVQASTLELVGQYAICIRWSDGHSTGIYRFDFLRELAALAPEERGLPLIGGRAVKLGDGSS